MNPHKTPVFNLNSERGFDAFFTHLFPALCAYATGYLKDAEKARDVVQDAFLTLWENRKNIKTFPEAKSYIYRVCSNSAIDTLRRDKRLSPGEADAVENSFAEQLMANELSHLLSRSVASLPAQTRKVLLLTLDGKSYKEVAEQLKISVNTVRNQRIRAVKHLKKEFSDYIPLLMLLSSIQ